MGHLICSLGIWDICSLWEYRIYVVYSLEEEPVSSAMKMRFWWQIQNMPFIPETYIFLGSLIWALFVLAFSQKVLPLAENKMLSKFQFRSLKESFVFFVITGLTPNLQLCLPVPAHIADIRQTSHHLTIKIFTTTFFFYKIFTTWYHFFNISQIVPPPDN